MKNRKHTQEAKDKISRMKLGKPRNPETREAISRGMTPRSPEVKKKISKGLKNSPLLKAKKIRASERRACAKDKPKFFHNSKPFLLLDPSKTISTVDLRKGINSGKTVKQMAAEFNVSMKTIYVRLEKAHLPTYKSKMEIPRKEFTRNVRKGFSISELSKAHNIAPVTVTRYLKKWGLKTNWRGKAH